MSATFSLLAIIVFPFFTPCSKLVRQGISQIPIPILFSKVKGVSKFVGGGLKLTGMHVQILPKLSKPNSLAYLLSPVPIQPRKKSLNLMPSYLFIALSIRIKTKNITLTAQNHISLIQRKPSFLKIHFSIYKDFHHF